MNNALSFVWLRRDLRLHDHAALSHGLCATSGLIQPVFIFDTSILTRFPGRDDRRLSFIASVICALDQQLRAKGGGLLVLLGDPREVLPKLVLHAHAAHIIAAEDYEPQTRARDAAVAKVASLVLVKDQVIFSPTELLRDKGEAYKVFTPYSRLWRAQLTPLAYAPYREQDKGRYAIIEESQKRAGEAGLRVLNPQDGPHALLQAVGYRYQPDALWPVDAGQARLQQFMAHHAAEYDEARNSMAAPGTSRLSPYIRFGLVSARECVAAAMAAGAQKWLSELIWREFYAMILYHFPESATTEWNPKYRKQLQWEDNPTHFAAWQEGKTGYPLVDAAMRQLLTEGWMHNRARMVVASFLTKHLRLDWRKGEEHFAQYLMDYDLASNVGGWQWAASTGTDAQPYFRVFNPTLQSEKFDPDGEYIRRYVPELRDAEAKTIHLPIQGGRPRAHYPGPIVDHAQARAAAIAMFKRVAE